MSKNKGMLLIILLLLLALILGACAFANGSDGTSAKTIDKPSLKFYGSTAMCSAAVTKTGKAVEATLELWQDRILVASWHKEDTGTVSFTESVVIPSDVSYTLILSGSVDGKAFDEQRFEYAPEGGSASPVQDADADYEYNTGKALVLARVTEVTPGPYTRLPYSLYQGIYCEVISFFGEEEMKDKARLDYAEYRYTNYSVYESLGYWVIDSQFKDMINNNDHWDPLIYVIYLSWYYKDMVEVGDVILAEIDSELDGVSGRGSFEDSHFLTIQPGYGKDNPSPHVAVFKDGKLQLSAELQESFNLRRLYDDTDPGRRAIRDGDTLEDVKAFMECVEQDVSRYRKDNPEKVVKASRPEMTVTENTANCKANVDAAGKHIEATLELTSIFRGDTANSLATWTKSGEDQVSFDEILLLTEGGGFQLRISGAADGVPFPPQTYRGTFYLQ